MLASAEPQSALLRIEEVTVHAEDALADDCATAGICGVPLPRPHAVLRVLCGRVEALSSDVPAAMRAALSARSHSGGAAARILALSAAPLRSCTPGTLLCVPASDLLFAPPDGVGRHVAIAALAVGLRSYLAFLGRAHPRPLAAGASVLLIDAAAVGAATAASIAVALGARHLLLHARSGAEQEALVKAASRGFGSVRVDVLPPSPAGGAGLAAAVRAATGGLGADIVFDASEAAGLCGVPLSALHAALRDSISATDDEEGSVAAAGAGPPSLIRREAGYGWPPATVAVVELSVLVRCLAPHGQLLTARPAPDIDAALCALMHAQGATMHLLNDAAWLLAPRWHGALLAVVQRLLEDVVRGGLRPPPLRLIRCPVAPLGHSNDSAAGAAAAATLTAFSAALGAALALEEPAKGVRAGGNGVAAAVVTILSCADDLSDTWSSV